MLKTITTSVYKYHARFEPQRAKAGLDNLKNGRGGNILHPESPLQHARHPKQQVSPDFIQINLIQHLVFPCLSVETPSNLASPEFPISAFHKC
jgi:hypothetical protein